jgi:xanthine/uracil permease
VQFKYHLDDRPGWSEMLLLGLQWFAVAIPIIIIIGKITGGFHFINPEDQIVYLQKLTFVMAVALFCQILLGHRLPLIIGPSTVLLIGITASQEFDTNTIYSAILCGGFLLTFLSITGLFGSLQRLFTMRVVAVVLLLIAFSLSPTILNLITVAGTEATPLMNLIFSLMLTFAMFILHRILTGVWKSTLIVWAMVLGSLVYFLLVPGSMDKSTFLGAGLVSGFFSHFTTKLSFDAGVMISFLFCYMALAVNDLGSIQSMNNPRHDRYRSGEYGIGISGCDRSRQFFPESRGDLVNRLRLPICPVTRGIPATAFVFFSGSHRFHRKRSPRRHRERPHLYSVCPDCRGFDGGIRV